jgi:putative addiction module killer protein
MTQVKQTPDFSKWLRKLKDHRARAVIARRIDRVASGNEGDCRTVGNGVSELRIDYGPGYRAYFTRRAGLVVILLCGGDKSSQDRDIKRAHQLAKGI